MAKKKSTKASKKKTPKKKPTKKKTAKKKTAKKKSAKASEKKEDTAETKKKKKKKKKKRKSRAKKAEDVRQRLYWGVFNHAMKPVAKYAFNQRKAAEKKARELSPEGKPPHFVQKIKEPIEEE